MALEHAELPLTDAPIEGLEDRQEWRGLQRRLDRLLKPIAPGMDAPSCLRRLMGVIRALGVEVVLFRADAGHAEARTDSTSGVRRATLYFDQPEAAGRKLAAGNLPFIGYEELWFDLATLAARTFLQDTHELLPVEDSALLSAVRDYLLVPASEIRPYRHRGESMSAARHRVWCFNSLPLSVYGAHKRPGRKSVKARRRVDIPAYRKNPASSEAL